MPPSFKKNLDNIMKESNYASISELFRDAVRALEDQKLIADIMESERDFAEGRFKRLRSLKDLM